MAGVGYGSERSSSAALVAYAALSVVGFALALGNAYVMQTRVHYADSYPARFGRAVSDKFGADKSLVTAVGTILEGCLHTSGFLLQVTRSSPPVSLSLSLSLSLPPSPSLSLSHPRSLFGLRRFIATRNMAVEGGKRWKTHE